MIKGKKNKGGFEVRKFVCWLPVDTAKAVVDDSYSQGISRSKCLAGIIMTHYHLINLCDTEENSVTGDKSNGE